MKQLHTLVTRDGRVTVPAEIRRKLGLEPGDRIAFVVDRGEVKLVRKGSAVGTAGIFRGRGQVSDSGAPAGGSRRRYRGGGCRAGEGIVPTWEGEGGPASRSGELPQAYWKD